MTKRRKDQSFLLLAKHMCAHCVAEKRKELRKQMLSAHLLHQHTDPLC